MPQVEAVASIIAFIRQQLGNHALPVYSHHQAAPSRKVDPLDFPWAILHDKAVHAMGAGKWVARAITEEA
jgi:N-acetyl-anhydromuramyl-L-alanine amidase AmpD